MANIFSGKNEKSIPRNLSECVQIEPTASKLHSWSETLENWGKILFHLLIAAGIISSIITTINMADNNEEMSMMTLFTSLATRMLYAFIEYCVYYVLALLISTLAAITQNTMITAKIALYEAAQKGADAAPVQPVAVETVQIPVFSDKEAGFCTASINRALAPADM